MSDNRKSSSPISETTGFIRESSGPLMDGLLKLGLSIIFYLVFTPLALIARLLQRDRLQRTFDADSRTYRRESREASRESLATTKR